MAVNAGQVYYIFWTLIVFIASVVIGLIMGYEPTVPPSYTRGLTILILMNLAGQVVFYFTVYKRMEQSSATNNSQNATVTVKKPSKALAYISAIFLFGIIGLFLPMILSMAGMTYHPYLVMFVVFVLGALVINKI